MQAVPTVKEKVQVPEFRVTAINKKRAVVDGQVWPYMTESSRKVYASPCGGYVLKVDGFFAENPAEIAGDDWARQSIIEAACWDAIKDRVDIAPWFLPILASGVLKQYLPPTAIAGTYHYWRHWQGGYCYRAWVVQERSQAEVPEGGNRSYDWVPPFSVKEAHAEGFRLMGEAVGREGRHGCDGDQYDADFRVYDYAL